jgi:RHS repeat-associated protein
VDGGVWIYTYDSHNGVLTARTDPLGRITTYNYDANRNLIKETAPDGSFTVHSYDSIGNLLSTTDALGNTTTYNYNVLGQVTSSTDPLGRTTTSSYDNKGLLTQTSDALGGKTTYAYDTKGNLASVTNALNQVSSFTYDAANNQTTSTDTTAATITFTYDAMGNMLTQTDTLGNVTTYEYDGRYRLARVTDPQGNVTSYWYDLKGNKISQTDANGNVTRYEYDDQGHLTKTIDAASFATIYTYGGTGCPTCGGGASKLTSLTDAKGQTTTYQYDLLGRLTTEADPLSKATTYAYDTVGNLTTRTDANGAAVSNTYDALKRLVKKTYPDASTVNYTYDVVGRIITTSNKDITYTYAYDRADRVVSVTDSRGYVITYAYDTLGNRRRMTLQPGTADQRITTYGYDGGGRLTGITANAGTFNYAYDLSGRRTALNYPNQVTGSYTYDIVGRLTNLKYVAGGSTISSFTYTNDKVGNRASKTYTEAEQYLYDVIYRLMTVTSDKPETFSFDAVGNRQTGPGAKDTAYLYSTGNQMLQGRKLQYGYDNNGNQTIKTIPAITDKSWVQIWDYDNRLVKMEKTKGSEKRTVSFNYDPAGRRIGKQVTTVIDGIAKNSVYSYVYDNDNIILENLTDDSGTTKTIFTHGANVDEHLALERNSSFYYYHSDGLGSVISITDQNKNVMQNYEYDSFGMFKSPATFTNSYTYTGREWDKETGLYYYRARYYDPMEGRFISKDPIGFSGGVNFYDYALSNPINYTDPSGLLTSQQETQIDTNRIKDIICKYLKAANYDFDKAHGLAYSDRFNSPAKDPYDLGLRNAEHYLWAYYNVNNGTTSRASQDIATSLYFASKAFPRNTTTPLGGQLEWGFAGSKDGRDGKKWRSICECQ